MYVKNKNLCFNNYKITELLSKHCWLSIFIAAVKRDLHLFTHWHKTRGLTQISHLLSAESFNTNKSLLLQNQHFKLTKL